LASHSRSGSLLSSASLRGCTDAERQHGPNVAGKRAFDSTSEDRTAHRCASSS